MPALDTNFVNTAGDCMAIWEDHSIASGEVVRATTLNVSLALLARFDRRAQLKSIAR